jgi:hypothetical protein
MACAAEYWMAAQADHDPAPATTRWSDALGPPCNLGMQKALQVRCAVWSPGPG